MTAPKSDRSDSPSTTPATRADSTRFAKFDGRLAWLVAGLGGLLIANAIGGALHGSMAAAGPGGVVGLALLACGIALALGARVALAATALCFVAAIAMADRLHKTANLIPALPIGVLAVALGAAVFAERRRRLLGRRASRASHRVDG